MKRCNCGEQMNGFEVTFYPKTYECPSCGATLMIDTKGIHHWYNSECKQGTYMPPILTNNKEEKE